MKKFYELDDGCTMTVTDSGKYMVFIEKDGATTYVCRKCHSMEVLAGPDCPCAFRNFFLGIFAIMFLGVPMVLVMVHLFRAWFS